MKRTSTIITSALALVASATLAIGQEGQSPNRSDRPDREGGNREEFRQRMNERLKTSMKVSDEEWGVLQPMIEKVQTKQREAMGSRWGGRGGRRGGDDNSQQTSQPGAAESAALRTALENESTSADDLKAKLMAVREQRKKAAAELEVAREDLRKVVTVRQEATLVALGVLE